MKIRKKESSVGVLGKILNLFNNSKKDTYSCDYINGISQAIATNIKTVDYSAQLTIPSEDEKYSVIKTSVPNGYSLIGYFIVGNSYNSRGVTSIIDSSDTTCVVNFCNLSTTEVTASIFIRGLYIKNNE